MAAYATVADVSGFVPTQIWAASGTSQPTEATVESWLDSASLLIDASLRWKYLTPVTDAGDQTILKPICAMLVAAQVWGVIGGHNAGEPASADLLRRQAYAMLAWDRTSGRSNLVLPNTALADIGEAVVGQAEGSFTDPDTDEGEDRMFRVSMEF